MIADFAARRPAGLEAAYREYSGVLCGVAQSVLGNASEAQDCVHDALLRVWSKPDSYRPERGPLRAFLIVCVRNEAIARKRAAARRCAIDERIALSRPAIESDLGDPIERVRVLQALRELPGDQRAALELAYYGGRTHSEIAAELGLPLGTVKSRLSLALRKLALRLRPQGEV